MTLRHTRHVVLVAVLLLAGLALFVCACGGSTTTTSVSDIASTTTSVSNTATTAAGSTGGPLVSDGTTSTVPEGETGVVEVKGLINNPMTLTAADLEGMDPVTVTIDDPTLGKQDYRGVRFSKLLTVFGLQSTVSRLAMTAHADGFVTEISLQDITWSPDAMLVISDDGKVNVVVPNLDSKAWVKDVITLEFK
jgi:hypothetical protein